MVSNASLRKKFNEPYFHVYLRLISEDNYSFKVEHNVTKKPFFILKKDTKIRLLRVVNDILLFALPESFIKKENLKKLIDD